MVRWSVPPNQSATTAKRYTLNRPINIIPNGLRHLGIPCMLSFPRAIDSALLRAMAGDRNRIGQQISGHERREDSNILSPAQRPFAETCQKVDERESGNRIYYML
jgi:hypothetical protein